MKMNLQMILGDPDGGTGVDVLVLQEDAWSYYVHAIKDV